MGVKTIFPAAVLVEGTEQTTLGYSKRLRIQITRVYRRIHMPVVIWFAHTKYHVTSLNLDVLVASETVDLQVSSRHAQVQT